MKKKYSKIFSLLLTLIMVMSSLSIVFAVDEVAPAAETDNTEVEELDETVTADALADAEPVQVVITVQYKKADGSQAAPNATVTCNSGDSYKFDSPVIAGYSADKTTVSGTAGDNNETIVVTYKPVAAGNVTGLVLHPEYNSITLTWNAVSGAKGYEVWRSTDGKNFSRVATPTSTSWRDTSANGTVGTFSEARTYYYRVYSMSQSNTRSGSSATVSGTCVRPMYETVTFKKACKLKSHGGKKATVKFAKGQTIVAQGFGGGKYRFWYNGSYFYASYARVKNCRASYQANSVANGKTFTGIWGRTNYAQNNVTSYSGINFYDKISAENFVNHSGQASKTGYLIWVSTYTQHMYIFTGSKGNWKLYKDWEVSTGAAKSPTPTGFGKKITKKIKKHSGIKWWSPFQTMNSIHGQRKSYSFGSPQSNGCVRNFDQNGKWVYDYCKKGTAVIVY